MVPSIDSESCHHYSRIPLASAHVNGSPVSALIGIPSLDYVGLIDHNIGVEVSSVDPSTCEVLRQPTTRFDDFGFNYKRGHKLLFLSNSITIFETGRVW